MPSSNDRSTVAHKILTYSGLFFILSLVMIPFSYIGISAFKSPMEMFEVKWWPDDWSLDAWRVHTF